MEKIGFYPLTIILSYLTEQDGVLFLITKRKFASQILPLFLVGGETGNQPANDATQNCDKNEIDSTVNRNLDVNDVTSQEHGTRNRKHYQFKVSPVQDPNMLLDRLNTRRLYQRQRRVHRTSSSTSTTQIAYIVKSHQTVSEMANAEWQQQAHGHVSPSHQWLYPPELELLRFKSISNNNISNHTGRVFQDLFQSQKNTDQNITLLVSYPRSGNTLLRTLLERTTGYVTGSDTRPDRGLSKELAEQHNLVGEGIIASNRVVYVKTHYPERLGHQIFKGQSAILVVRNPYDAIDSYWNMNATKSHTKSLTPEMYDKYSGMWSGLVQNEIHIWNKFLDFWLNDDCPIPVLVIRFEDLIRNPARELQRILEFTIQQNNADNKKNDHVGQAQQDYYKTGTQQLSEYWMSRIQHCCNAAGTPEKLGSYQPRSATSGVTSIGKTLRTGQYTNEMLDYIYQVCALNYPTNYLRRFGYDIPTQNFPNNFISPQDDNDVSEPSFTLKRPSCSNDNFTSFLRVNDGIPIRPVDCIYGRRLQQWRHSETNNDRDPLPTIGKSK